MIIVVNDEALNGVEFDEKRTGLDIRILRFRRAACEWGAKARVDRVDSKVALRATDIHRIGEGGSDGGSVQNRVDAMNVSTGFGENAGFGNTGLVLGKCPWRQAVSAVKALHARLEWL